MLTKLIGLLLTVHLLPLFANADQGKKVSSDNFDRDRKLFCGDPEAFVCKDARIVIETLRIKRSSVANKALEKAQPRMNRIPARVRDEFSRLVRAAGNGVPKNIELDENELFAFIEAAKIYLNELENLSPLKKKQLESMGEDYKDRQKKLIEKSKYLSRAQKDEMKARVEKVEIISFERILARLSELAPGIDRNREVQMRILATMASSFGTDFLADTSKLREGEVQVELPGGRRTNRTFIDLIVSPGEVFGMDGRMRHAAFSVSPSVGHEFSHVNDWTQFPQLYEKMAGCFLHEFKESPEMTWNQKEGVEKRKAFWENFKEFIADNGSADLLMDLMNDKGLAGTEQGLQILKAQLMEYCHLEPGNHASGKFRIATNYRANPSVAKAFCSDFKPEPVTCTLGGRYPSVP